MMNKTSSIVLREADHSRCSTSSLEASTTPVIPSILPPSKNIFKSTKPSSNLLVSHLENLFIAVSLCLFFVFVTVLTLFVHFIVTCGNIIQRLRQPRRRETRINTTHLNLEGGGEEEEEIFKFCFVGFRLSQGDLKNLSSFIHGNVDEATDRDCVVCLESLREGEICRSLPKCKHSFHADCVDSWLIRVPSCPVCREVVARPEVKRLVAR